MYLLLSSLILILALLAIRLSNRYGIPSLLLFIVLGMATTVLGFDFSDFVISEKVASFALIIIMFYGGYGTNLKMGRSVLKESIVLSSLGTILTALATGFFAHTFLGFPLVQSLLLGSVVGSTDYASVSSILSSKNLNLKYNTASLLEIESGSNDPTAYTMTMIFLSMLTGANLSIPLLVFKQIGFAIALGLAFSYLFSIIVDRMDFSQDGLFTIFVFAMAIGVYSLTGVIGGNGYLSVYIFGIIIGNKEYKGKRETVFFFDGFTELMQIILFFILGLLSDPKALISVMPISLIIMLFMTFIVRPIVTAALLVPMKGSWDQIAIISWAGIRGAAAIAFAIMVVNSAAPLSIDVFHIVFGVCLISSLVQGSLMPRVVEKFKMLDSNDTVLKTFNYYQDKSDIGFIQTKIHDSHLVGSKVKDLNLTFDFIIAKLRRQGQTIIPTGNTEIQEGDLIIIGGESYFDPKGDELLEFTVGAFHPWKGKKIVDLKLNKDKLILMVLRGEETLIPTGDTQILEGDKVVLSKQVL